MRTPSRTQQSNRCTSATKPAGFAVLKCRLSHRLASEWQSVLPEALIRRAVNEAEELAQATGFPDLFFPELAAEQVRRVSAFAMPELPVPALTDVSRARRSAA